MRQHLLAAAAAFALTVPALAQDTPPPADVAPSPGEIVEAAPASDWIAISPADLLVMDLAPDAAGKPRRVVIQLMPAPFSQGWIGNIRKLAAAHWWDGTSVNRVQDNYVVQWGDATEEKALPEGLAVVPESDYSVDNIDMQITLSGEKRTPDVVEMYREAMDQPDDPSRHDRLIDVRGTQTASARAGWHQRDSYAEFVEFHQGWPLGAQGINADARFWPVHCYGMVGVGRNLSPDTGSGAELYTVIGQAPRHLDRNIALVGRVVSGIDHLSSLPRGTGALGFYESEAERVIITAIRLASSVPAAERPKFEYLSTESDSFRRYTNARANRRDPFFIRPAGGADICNIPVPVRAVTK